MRITQSVIGRERSNADNVVVDFDDLFNIIFGKKRGLYICRTGSGSRLFRRLLVVICETQQNSDNNIEFMILTELLMEKKYYQNQK